MKVLTLGFIIALVLGVVSPSQFSRGYIVGGVKVDIEDVPYQLQLEGGRGMTWEFICGAVIIGRDSALTAAHCIPRGHNESIRLLAGSDLLSSGTVHDAVSVVVHPNYATSAPDCDIAYIKVSPPFQFSSRTKPIKIATAEPKPGEIATVSGWGETNFMRGGSYNLLKTELPVLDRKACRDVYSVVTERMICAGASEGGKDSCRGDSGGPFVVNGTLAGLVSRGNGCGRPHTPGIYTNIAAFSKSLESLEGSRRAAFGFLSPP